MVKQMKPIMTHLKGECLDSHLSPVDLIDLHSAIFGKHFLLLLLLDSLN